MRLAVSLVVLALLLNAESRIVLENDSVRILSTTLTPREKTPQSNHDFNLVVVRLDPGNSGEVVWVPAGTTRAMGRQIEIELKRPAPSAPAARNAKRDPVAIDPSHNTLFFENAQVRVFRSTREAGGTEMMHEHAGWGRATVLLSDMEASVKLADGTVSKAQAKRLDVLWSGPVTHATTNLGTKPIEMIVVEVK
jgi:hypothetical protein